MYGQPYSLANQLGGYNFGYQPPVRQQPQQMQMPSFNPMSMNGGMFGGGSGGGGGTGAMGSLGPIAAIMAAVALTKGLEYRNSDNALGKLGQTFNAPSISQIQADPKVGFTTALGIPFINSFIMNKKAKNAKPEWESILGF